MTISSSVVPVALAASLALGFATTASASVSFFTDKALFLAAVSNPGVDTFDDVNFLDSTPSPLNRTAGAYSYVAATQGQFFGGNLGADPFLSTNAAIDDIIFSGFSAGVSAIGGEFFGSDVFGDFAPVGSISFLIDAGGSESSFSISSPLTTSFFGVLSTTGLLSLTVLSPTVDGGAFFWPSANNLILAQAEDGGGTPAIPEPTTWAMLITGFGMVGFAARRRRPIAA